MKTINQYLYENSGPETKQALLSKDDFNIGCEIEFISNSQSNSIKKQCEAILNNYTPRYGNLEITNDITVYPDNKAKNEKPIEIVTPAYSYDDFMEFCPKLLDIVIKYGYTNETCGFHAGISSQKFDIKNINTHALAAAYEEGDLRKDMPTRSNTYYAKLLDIKHNMTWKDPEDKEQVIRIHPPINSKNIHYIELRQLGGENYEHKWNTIKNKIIKTVTNIYHAYYDEEYQMRKRKQLTAKIIDLRKEQKLSGYTSQDIEHLINNPKILSYLIKHDPFWKKLLLGEKFTTLCSAIRKLELQGAFTFNMVKYVQKNMHSIYKKQYIKLKRIAQLITDENINTPDDLRRQVADQLRRRNFPPWVEFLATIDFINPYITKEHISFIKNMNLQLGVILEKQREVYRSAI